jgi:pimeloyl-ACP methyl ester carboxylesterase
VHANGIRLHYHRTGGGGPPVVLAHGITDNALCWTRLARALAGEFDLILVDARGHGESDKPEDGYGSQDHAADLAGVIRGLGLARPAVVGHSMGAASAAALLAANPGLTAGAVLEDPPWRSGPPAQDPQAWVRERSAALARQQQLSPAALEAEARAANPDWADDEFAAWAQAKRQASANIFKFTPQSRMSWRELVPRFAEPVLLVRGDPQCGGIIDQAVADEVQQLNPLVRVAHISGASHSIRRTRFEPYVEVVRQFLRSILGVS